MAILKKSGATLALALALGAGSYHAAHAELILNGGFETGDFTDWTQSGNTGSTLVDVVSPASGTYSAQLGPQGSDGFLSQTIATTPGNAYTFSFDLQNKGGGVPNDFSASFGADTPLSFTDADTFDYTHYSFNEVATDPSTVVQFTFRQDPSFFHLDNVSVVDASAVPEPSAATFLVLGAAFIGAMTLRRRAVVRAF